MKLLALDTATEHCSVALLNDGEVIERGVTTPRGHADLILPMIKEVMQQAGIAFPALDAIAFGRGPGGFTGVRIAVSVAQGLAFAHDLPVVPVSNLAAVARRAALTQTHVGDILVCMDARMAEVYWSVFRPTPDSVVALLDEQVSAPEQVEWREGLGMGVGTGFAAYPSLHDRFVTLQLEPTLLPRATEILQLAVPEVQAGRMVSAAEAQPVYVRDQVTHRKAAE